MKWPRRQDTSPASTAPAGRHRGHDRPGPARFGAVTSGPAIRVVLCDDHVMVLEGLKRVIEGVEQIDVVATASDGEAGVDATVRLRPDVVLMDLAMPKVNGVEATRRIAAALPDTRVVVLTSFAENARVLEALDAGATGYILKDAAAHELV